MSLEAALEEERLDVLKLLEAQPNHHRGRNHTSLSPPGGRQHSSLLLDDSDGTLKTSSPLIRKPSAGLLQPDSDLRPRSKSYGSATKTRPILEDPSDPYLVPGSYYYSSSDLRPASPSLGGPATDLPDLDRLRLSVNSAHITSSNSGRSHPEQRSSSYSRASGSGSGARSTSPFNSGTGTRKSRADSLDFHNAYRRLSANNIRKSGGTLGEVYREGASSARSPSADRRLSEDNDGVIEDSEEEDEEDVEDETSDSAIDTDSEDEDVELNEMTTSMIPKTSSTLLAAMEDERKSIAASKFKVKSLLDIPPPPGTPPPPSMAEYAAYKRRIIHPNTAFDTDFPQDTPYTSDTEEILDAQRAAKMDIDISTIYSNTASKRMLRTMVRGDLPSLSDPDLPRPKSFVVATDLSPEATHALEWTIGTVLRDTNVLYAVCAFEEDPSSTAAEQEEERMDAMTKITNTIVKLLKKTRLQVHVVVEVIHCKSPKYLLTEVIDHITPTMVILGSRGRSALKGVLLGSFSNYIVEKSSVPVMVARRKLQKTKNKGLNVRLANNLRGGLSTAKVD